MRYKSLKVACHAENPGRLVVSAPHFRQWQQERVASATLTERSNTTTATVEHDDANIDANIDTNIDANIGFASSRTARRSRQIPPRTLS
jgi:hypothetical protein